MAYEEGEEIDVPYTDVEDDAGKSDNTEDTSGALDTGADLTTPHIESALAAVNAAMMYGREKHGLPRGDEEASAIPAQPAGPGGDRPNPNPFPTKGSFGRLAGNIPTQPAGPGGERPNTNPFPVKRPNPPFGRSFAALGELPSYVRGGPVKLEEGGPPDDNYADPPDAGEALQTTDVAPTADNGITTGPQNPNAPYYGPSPGYDRLMADSAEQKAAQDFLAGKDAADKKALAEAKAAAADTDAASVAAAAKTQEEQWGIIQAQRNDTNDALHKARKISSSRTEGEELSDSDGNKVAGLLEKALSNVPTGEKAKVSYIGDGLYQFEVTPPGGGKPKVTVLNENQVHDLQNIGKGGQFDTMYERQLQGTLADLKNSPGTPLPKKAKADTEKTNTGTVWDRYPLSLRKAAASLFPNVSQQAEKIAWLENKMENQAERTSKETQAEGRTAGLEHRAQIAADWHKAGQQETTDRQLRLQQNRLSFDLRKLNQQALTAEEKADLEADRTNTSMGKPNPPQLQRNLEQMAIRHGAAAAARQQEQEQGQESPLPSAVPRGTAPVQGAPPARAVSPTGGVTPQGGARYGKQITVIGADGKPRIMVQPQ